MAFAMRSIPGRWNERRLRCRREAFRVKERFAVQKTQALAALPQRVFPGGAHDFPMPGRIIPSRFDDGA